MSEITPVAEALDVLLNSNFDADCKECLLTLLKLIDNIRGKPGVATVRKIRLANPNFAQKVGRCKGGVEILLACGFVPVVESTTTTPSQFQLSPFASSTPMEVEKEEEEGGAANATAQHAKLPANAEFIELLPQQEDYELLGAARDLLASKAVQVLGMEVPPPKMAPAPPPSLQSPSSSASFDPYKPHNFNTQRAGREDATNIVPDNPSGPPVSTLTERKVQDLQNKQKRMEQKMQRNLVSVQDRNLQAFRPATSGGSAVAAAATTTRSATATSSSSSGDGALLLSHAKKMEEERKKREEGGLTTKAMRDLEKMKKAKVYSHTQLRIHFPNGCFIQGMFLPGETLASVKQVLQESCFLSPLDFDIYVSPPRRLLSLSCTLAQEGLVPAAKIHISWKVASNPHGAEYIRPDLFAGYDPTVPTTGVDAHFPVSQNVVETTTKESSTAQDGKKKAAKSSANNSESKEAALMKRMGLASGGGGLLSSSSSSSSSSMHKKTKKDDSGDDDKKKKKSGSSGTGGGHRLGGSGTGKPKWFKG